jgi:hypothetical protein
VPALKSGKGKSELMVNEYRVLCNLFGGVGKEVAGSLTKLYNEMFNTSYVYSYEDDQINQKEMCDACVLFSIFDICLQHCTSQNPKTRVLSGGTC